MSTVYAWGEQLAIHGGCVGDEGRTAAYRTAIERIVKPGDVVVDVGSGTGVLGILACRAGARRVYAIDRGPILSAARKVCAANGFEDRFVFLSGLSHEVEVPEKADVFIAGHLHNFGLETGLLSSLADARARYLKPEAKVIPKGLELHMAPVEAFAPYERFVSTWGSNPCGIDFSGIRSLAVNTCYLSAIAPSGLLSEPQLLSRLDLEGKIETHTSGSFRFEASRSGVLHGFAGWVRAELSPQSALSNDPRSPNIRWAQAFFPVPEPLALRPGDPVACTVDAYDGKLWRWRTQVAGRSFDQSTFLAAGFTRDMFSG